jgi:hypothetical protein
MPWKWQVDLTIEAADEEEGQRKLDAIADMAGAKIEELTTTVEQLGGVAILVPKDQFAEADTDIRSVMISRQDAEVCDKALTVVLNWWEAGAQAELLSDEGSSDQLRDFPFQRLMLIAERYEEAA